MTPKEKAEELFDKFNNYSKDNIPDFDKYFDSKVAINISKYSAKQCALIAIDEMIDFSMYTIPEVKESIFNYLNEVKQEIEKL